MAKQFTLRVQSPDHGTKRVEISADGQCSLLFDKVEAAFGLPRDSWLLYLNRNKTGPFKSSRKKIKSVGLSHGQMVYLFLVGGSSSTSEGGVSSSAPSSQPPFSSNGVSMNGTSAPSADGPVFMDEIDRILEKEDGKIQREMDKQLCQHGPQGKCFHCVPYESFDEKYLASYDPPIKFLSFHSYLRKLQSGADRGKFVWLENLSCKIKPGCTGHPPWPAGICTKCQPNAVTLSRQTYRHVDNVMFENPSIMDKFLNSWRSSGCQRIGYLIGRYERHPDMPLAIRAVVSAIYEPTQICEKSSVELVTDAEEEALLDFVLPKLGVQRVGWIFTDLVAARNLTSGTVKHFRGTADSHFLSAEECIVAADLQNKYANHCKLASEGIFGSKFVTVVVTGDKENQIGFEAYQVTDQCMGLVRDNCLVPTYDSPGLGYIRESSNEQYVPDVFYKEVDKYGNAVTLLGRPLPVEFLLVDMSVAFSKDELYSLIPKGSNPFPSSRKSMPVSPGMSAATGGAAEPSFAALGVYLNQFDARDDKDFLKAARDLNLLLFLSACDVVPLKEHIHPLLEAVRTGDSELAHRWSSSEHWQTVLSLLDASTPTPMPPSGAASSPSCTAAGSSSVRTESAASFTGPHAAALPPIGSTWTCPHCTFINTSTHTSCDMCSLPKQ